MIPPDPQVPVGVCSCEVAMIFKNDAIIIGN